MAVSYVSQTFKSSPYVPPVDLNLMAKVLSYKQEQFDTTATKIQSQLDTVANSDVLKGVDKQYINAKLNSLVENVNSLGGVDLADVNIGNQIGGYASSIYNDDNITNAISSTKRVRSLQASYDKMKTDPKLIKYYSESNEYNDSLAVQSYAADPNVGASYQGNSAATRFVDYDADFRKMLDAVKAEKDVQLSAQGFYFNKTTGEIVDPNTIMSIARDRMQPHQRAQMERDGVYLYQGKLGFGAKELVMKAMEDKGNQLSYYKQLADEIRGQAIAEGSPAKTKQLKEQAKKYDDYATAVQQEIKDGVPKYIQMYQNNPREFMYMVYSNDYFRGLGNTYKVKRIDRDITVNQAAVKVQDWKEQWNQQTRDINSAHELAQMKNDTSIKMKEMELIAAGKGKYDENGKFIFTATIGAGDGSDVIGYAPFKSDKPEDMTAIVDSEKNKVAGLDDESRQIKEGIMAQMIADNPDAAGLLDQTVSWSEAVPESKPELGSVEDVFGYIVKPLNWLGAQVSKAGAAAGAQDPANAAPKSITKSAKRFDHNNDGVVNQDDFIGYVKYNPTTQKYDKVDATAPNESEGIIPAVDLIKNTGLSSAIRNTVSYLDNSTSGYPTPMSQLPKGVPDKIERLKLNELHKQSIQSNIDAWEKGGINNFTVPQFSNKYISESSYPKRNIEITKNYLLDRYFTGVNISQLDLIKISTNPDGLTYTMSAKIHTGSGNKAKEEDREFTDIPLQIGNLFGIKRGDYAEVNDMVTKTKPLEMSFQNGTNPELKGKIRVYKNGNDDTYTSAYVHTDPSTGLETQVPLPSSFINPQRAEFAHPQDAYIFGKKFIEQVVNQKFRFQSDLENYLLSLK